LANRKAQDKRSSSETAPVSEKVFSETAPVSEKVFYGNSLFCQKWNNSGSVAEIPDSYVFDPGAPRGRTGALF
jgi:hypothetical protein